MVYFVPLRTIIVEEHMYSMLVWWLTQGVTNGTWDALCAHETLQTLSKQQWSCPVAPIKNLDAFYKGSPAFWKDYFADGYDHSRLTRLQNFLCFATPAIFRCLAKSRSVFQSSVHPPNKFKGSPETRAWCCWGVRAVKNVFAFYFIFVEARKKKITKSE